MSGSGTGARGAGGGERGVGRRGFARGAAAAAAGLALTGATASRAAAEDVPSPAPDGGLHGGRTRMRGLWIASVANTDWPSRPGLPAEQQQAELLAHYDLAVARRLNTVIVQVRPTADAFWPSPLEPWSAWLTGTQGVDPGYDPLGFAVEEAHRRGLEFHAWMNPYRVTQSGGLDTLVPTHPARLHPEWTVSYGGKVYFNPGVPDARRHVEAAMLDAVLRYDVDALHWDDYFYPYPVAGQTFDDDATFRRYGAGWTDKGDWRRHNIDLLVQETAARVRAVKPGVRFGISPFGVWRNRATDPRGSDTRAGVQTYDDLGADTRGWVRKGWLDYLCPQVYWNIGFAAADYAKLVDWWSAQMRGTRCELYIGEAVYKVGDPAQPAAWQDPAELSRHLDLCARHPQVRGNVYFSAKDVRADRLGAMTKLVEDHYGRRRGA